jgi:hypothetical protein
LSTTLRRITRASLHSAGAAVIASAVLVPLASTAPAHAASPVVYVAEGGSDVGDCGAATSACATVTYALTKVSAAGTVKVGGTIYDNVVVPDSLPGLTISGADAPAGSPAVIDGGGTARVMSANKPLTVDHLTIRNGKTTGNGGGIFAGDDLTVLNSTLTGNTGVSGGSIYGWYSDVVIIDSTITTSSSTTAGFGGGAVFDGYGSVSVIRSTLAGNKAPSGGGGAVYMYDVAPLSVVDSTISGNTATNAGGGLSGRYITVVNSTIANNTASFGGAISNVSGTSSVIASTISGNSAGAINTVNGTTRIGATILGSGAGGSMCSGSGGSFVSGGYNLVADSSCGFTSTGDLQGQDPSLGALQNNGGPTLTQRPSAASPAVNRIPIGTVINGVQVCEREDQRGVPGPVTGATACAAGAVEPAGVPQAPLLVTSTEGDVLTPLTLTASGGTAGGALSYQASDGTASGCAVSGSPAELSAETAGTCLVTATKAADGVYDAVSSVPTTVTLAKAVQAALHLVTVAGTVGTPLALRISGGSGTGAVGFAVIGGTGCSLSRTPPYTLTAGTAGTCVVRATKAADARYDGAVSAAQTVRFSATVPGTVRRLKVTGKASAKRRSVTWQAPASLGGTRITGYRVVVVKGSRTVFKATVTTTRIILRSAKLHHGRFTVRVQALNGVGPGRAVAARFTVR